MKLKKAAAFIAAAMLAASLSACAEPANTPQNGSEEPSVTEEKEENLDNMDTINAVSERVSVTAEPGSDRAKTKDQMNPLISHRYSADPTSVEYNGRVYVFSTNDHQQYLTGSEENTYRDIHSLNVFSSDDMVNWTDHGYIDVRDAAPYCNTSWAPSVVKREEDDGLTHFYLFYALDGWSTGVLTATDPLGPWTDPVGKAVIRPDYPEVDGYMVNCFDPGAFVDDDGTIYVACGGGTRNSESLPQASAIVELDDNLKIVGHPHVIDAPYFFEASEFDKIGGKYVYTYNSNWQQRTVPVEGYTPSPICAMEYMVSDKPEGPYVYKGSYFRNPGEAGFFYGNNHTHLQKFNDKWYIFHHTRMLEEQLGIERGFRSVMVDEIEIDEETVTIKETKGSRTGVAQVKSFDPYRVNRAATMCSQSGVTIEMTGGLETVVAEINEGDWIRVKGVDFSNGASQFIARVKGKGVIDIRLDDVASATVGSVDFDTDEYANIVNNVDNITGTHDVYFLLGGDGWKFDSWQFTGANS